MDRWMDGWMNGVSFDPVRYSTKEGLDDWGALLGYILEIRGLGVDIVTLDMSRVRYMVLCSST